MKRNTRMDYRLYHVEPPGEWSMMWRGQALLRGMPNVEAASERDLRDKIDDAYSRRRKER